LARFKRGDRVVIVDRPVTAADRKSGLFYNHFRGLHGSVDQIYEEAGEVCVEVDLESLPPEFGHRHLEIQEQARQKWLDSLSEQERRSIPAEHRELRHKYTVIVAPEDLAPEPRGKERKPAAHSNTAEATARPQAGGADRPSGAAPAEASAAAATARRATEADLAAQEEAHLQELRRRTQGV